MPPPPFPQLAELVGHPVAVHLNLTTRRWTVAAKPKGRKAGDAAAVALRAVTFRVSEAQRRYCVDKGARWVHAWALGHLVECGEDAPELPAGLVAVTYNPFRAPTFHVPGEERPVVGAAALYLTPDGRAYAVDPR